MTSESDKLGTKARAALEESGAEPFLSDVSVWEICLKWSVDKIRLPAPPRRWVESQAKAWELGRLPLVAEHYYRTTELPHIHHDPFDRLLVAQAISEDLAIVTPDSAIRRYPVDAIW